LLYLISFEILFNNDITNWKDFLSDNLNNLTTDFNVNNTLNSIKNVLQENQFYFYLLKTSDKNSNFYKFTYKNRKDKCFVNISNFNDLVLENIIEKSLRSIPISFLEAYSNKNLNKKEDKIFLNSFERIKMDNSFDKQIIQSLDL